MYTLLRQPETALDGHWADRLSQIQSAIGETFDRLMPPLDMLEADYQKFISSEGQEVPDLYPVIDDRTQLLAQQESMATLLADLTQGPNQVIRRAYQPRIEELQANVNMILAAADHDDTGFERANRLIYHGPDPAVFAAACTWLRSKAENYQTNSSEVQAICNSILDAVPEVEGDPRILMPDDATFQKVRQLHIKKGGFIDQLFAGATLPDNELFTPLNSDSFTRLAIRNVGSDFELQESAVGLWSVLQSQQAVVRPPDYELSRQAFMGIVAHEVGSHLLESVNGSRSKLRLLEMGMDRYEAGNEGRAFLREQVLYESFEDYIQQPGWYPTKASWEYRIAIHLVISLACGLPGRTYGFTELVSIVRRFYTFWTVTRGQPVDSSLIDRGAWNLVVRALKGTNGQRGAYLKDIVYLEGNIRCWQAATANPDVILYGDVGKFDIANQKHVMILSELGILPSK